MHPDTEIDLWLIRHGEAEHNLDKTRIGGGRSDGELTEVGLEQARALGDYLASQCVRFDVIHSSAMRRAIQTAHVIRSRLRCQLEIGEHPEFNELNQGDFESMTREEVYTPARCLEMSHRSMDFKPPGGESQRELQRRAWTRLEELVIHNSEITDSGRTSRIAIVTHKVTINVLLQAIHGSERSQCWRQAIRNTSFSRIRYTVDGWIPDCTNATPHLELQLERSNHIM